MHPVTYNCNNIYNPPNRNIPEQTANDAQTATVKKVCQDVFKTLEDFRSKNTSFLSAFCCCTSSPAYQTINEKVFTILGVIARSRPENLHEVFREKIDELISALKQEFLSLKDTKIQARKENGTEQKAAVISEVMQKVIGLRETLSRSTTSSAPANQQFPRTSEDKKKRRDVSVRESNHSTPATPRSSTPSDVASQGSAPPKTSRTHTPRDHQESEESLNFDSPREEVLTASNSNYRSNEMPSSSVAPLETKSQEPSPLTHSHTYKPMHTTSDDSGENLGPSGAVDPSDSKSN